MGYFTARERSALGKSINEKAPSRSREFAREDFAPRRRSTNTDIGGMIQQLREDSVGRIDALIAELHRRRDAIVAESTRMHREIIEYARLNQSTMNASRAISESLATLVKLRNAPAMADVVEAVSDTKDRNGAFGESAERNETSEPADASSSLATAAATSGDTEDPTE